MLKTSHTKWASKNRVYGFETGAHAETAETAEFRFFNKKHIFQKKITATRPKYLTLQLMDIVFFAPNYSNNTTVTPVN